MASIPPTARGAGHVAPRDARDDRRDVVALAAAPGTGARRSDDRRRRRCCEVLAALARAVRPGSRLGRHLPGHLVRDPERPVENAGSRPRQLVAHRLGRSGLPLHRLRQRTAGVPGGVPPRPTAGGSGRPLRRPGGRDRRISRMVTPRQRRPPTANASTSHSAPADCWPSISTAPSSGSRTSARCRRITAPPARRCSTGIG